MSEEIQIPLIMKRMLALLALATSVLATPYPQAVTSAIAPSSAPPAGCETSHSGTFQITVVNVSTSATKRDLGRVSLYCSFLILGVLTEIASIGRPSYFDADRLKLVRSGGSHWRKYTPNMIGVKLSRVRFLGRPSPCTHTQTQILNPNAEVQDPSYRPVNVRSKGTPENSRLSNTQLSLQCLLPINFCADLNLFQYIAANYQFQFDAPPQAGAIYTTGFSLCANGSLALGGSAIFYQCLSGSFYNLYDRDWA